jgi:hypothetical protein
MCYAAHPYIRDEFRVRWSKDNISKYPLDIDEGDDGADDDHQQRTYKMSSQIINMISKGHFPQGVLISFAEKGI